MTVLPVPRAASETAMARACVDGKFFWRGAKKSWIKGVTYGTFAPDAGGEPYPDHARVSRDFAAMRAAGINAIRTYTVPPRWLLDEAHAHGLGLLAGLPWQQHVAFLDRPSHARAIVGTVRQNVARVAGHPALLGLAIGNEIPGEIVRWHGRRRIEGFLERLYRAARAEDPVVPLTYVNFPTTEYLELPFVDFVAFNVYLEDRKRLEAYLARLQNLAGDKPLVLAEVGLDSRRNGLDAQAATLSWQIDAIFGAGCAGSFVFAWTDEWHRGGAAIPDWDFGLTDRQRRPKPAFHAVRAAYSRSPFGSQTRWPRISVAICSYNGSRTLADALAGATMLDYPDYEVIVVDDGSTDATAEIAAGYPVRLVRTANQGLSAARNEAWRAATGEIVAYTDDDARPDPDWLRFLAQTFEERDVAAVGGPNIPPAGDGWIADCVARSPGGPMHVLLDDITAEHVPGCNSAYRRQVLEELGGFDPRFRVAGDDVDMCWRVQDAGYSIGFNPAATVWHHRRNEVRTYWRQQQGYGKAEALLEAKWPQRYNALGHLRWQGAIYGEGRIEALRLRRARIYHGTWGSAPFQRLYRPPAGVMELPTMPEWYLLLPSIVLVALAGLWWSPLRWAIPVLVVAAALPLVQAAAGAARARFDGHDGLRLNAAGRFRRRALTTWLHLVQPIARLKGRVEHGLTPWRQQSKAGWKLPRPRRHQWWSETWRAPQAWRETIARRAQELGGLVRIGGTFDPWDLEIVGGPAASVRMLITVEEHGQSRQLIRLRSWPRLGVSTLIAGVGIVGLALLATKDGAIVAAVLLAIVAILPLLGGARDLIAADAQLRSLLLGGALQPEASDHA